MALLLSTLNLLDYKLKKKKKKKERIQAPWRQEMLAILFTNFPLHLNSYNSLQHRMGSQFATESPQKGLQSLGSCSRTQQPCIDMWPTWRVSHNKCSACDLSPAWLMHVSRWVHCSVLATRMPTPLSPGLVPSVFSSLLKLWPKGCSSNDVPGKPALFSEQVLAAALSVPPSTQHLSRGWYRIADSVRPCSFRPRTAASFAG